MAEFTPEQLMAAFAWGETPLTENVSMFDDFWGTVMAIKPSVKTDETTGRITNSFECVWRIDGTEYLQNRFWNVPTDPAGNIRVNEEGNPARPHVNSTWGKQEQFLQTSMNMAKGSLFDLVGLHVHVKRMEIVLSQSARDKREGKDPISLTGLYMIETDGVYDSVVRRAAGLSPVISTTPTFVPGDPTNVPLYVTVDPDILWEHVELLVSERAGGSYISYRARVADALGAEPVAQNVFDGLRDSGVLAKSRAGIYSKGPKFEEA